jgi:beta-galactosidase
MALRLTAERTEIDADGEDVAILTVSAVDSQGRSVPTADVLVDFKFTGEGALIGVGNGDPNCQESDKDPRRSLFSGLAQAIVQSTKTAGTIEIVAEVNVRNVSIEPAKITITTKQAPPRPTV